MIVHCAWFSKGHTSAFYCPRLFQAWMLMRASELFLSKCRHAESAWLEPAHET